MEYTEFLERLDKKYPYNPDRRGYKTLSKQKSKYNEELQIMHRSVASVVRNAKKGKKEALLALALCNQHGLGIEQDIDKAISILELLCDKAFVPAFFHYAELILEEQMYDKTELALSLYERAHDEGDAEATFALYVWYHYGLFSEQDDVKALYYLLTAVDRLHPAGMREYGKYMLFGVYGVEQDEAKALQFLQKAVKAGDVHAKQILEVYNEENIKERQAQLEAKKKKEEEEKARQKEKEENRARRERILRGTASKKDIAIEERHADSMTEEDKAEYELLKLSIENEKLLEQFQKEIEEIEVVEDESVDKKISEYEALLAEFGGLSEDDFLSGLGDDDNT